MLPFYRDQGWTGIVQKKNSCFTDPFQRAKLIVQSEPVGSVNNRTVALELVQQRHNGYLLCAGLVLGLGTKINIVCPCPQGAHSRETQTVSKYSHVDQEQCFSLAAWCVSEAPATGDSLYAPSSCYYTVMMQFKKFSWKSVSPCTTIFMTWKLMEEMAFDHPFSFYSLKKLLYPSYSALEPGADSTGHLKLRERSWGV